MSKIQVDAIEQQTSCGSTLTVGGGASKTVVVDATTVTLGRSGGTVALASGASQTGFGRTGTVDWQTGSIKTATFTAANGEGYFANTAGGTFTMNLPAGVVGAIVSVQDYNNTFDSNALTVDANGTEKINGGDGGQPVELTTEGRGVTFVYVDSTVGWRSVQDNDFTKKGVNATFITATGGTISTVCTNFKVHTFTGPGTFTVCSVGNPAGSSSVDYLIVAGGGGGAGATDNGTGAGGGGGFRTSASTYSGPPLAVACGVTVTAQGYPIVVGGGGPGGPGGTPSPGTIGVSSSALSLTSTGGGVGRAYNEAGGNGGSGGGAGEENTTGGTGNTPPVSPPQGNNGGAAQPGGRGTGGGGGATEAGVTGTGPTSGRGGAGAPNAITGGAVNYAGGGGGGIFSGTPGAASPCGTGGAGKPIPATDPNNGTTNRGGGGGGSGGTGAGTCVAGGNGGSGIVIIRYKFQ